MQINPINFTGIKNIGYVKVYASDEESAGNRTCMSMELTDDKKNKDLTKYKNLLKKSPLFVNELNKNNINFEIISYCDGEKFAIVPKINGQMIFKDDKSIDLYNFAKNLVRRIKNFKAKDFQQDRDYFLFDIAQDGLVYKEPIEDYLTGVNGKMELLEGSGLTEKFDYYLNEVPDKLTDKETEMIGDAALSIVETLYHPQHVHNGAIYMDILLKGMDKMGAEIKPN